ncbi:MAG TPA: hypothetical protein VGJ81_00365 [Thermoanaerobaculia bacterium]|jgi:hypothetical protein
MTPFRRTLLVLIIFVDCAIALVLINAALLLFSSGNLGEWYAHWADAVIAVYGVASFAYIVSLLIFGIVLARDVTSSVARRLGWMLLAIFFGYIMIPAYLLSPRGQLRDK